MLLVLWFCVVLALIGPWAMATKGYLINFTRTSLTGDSNNPTSTRVDDLEFIDEFWPHRLIQPQWLDDKPGAMKFLFHWSHMEFLARLGVCLLVTILLAFFTLQLVKRIVAHLSQEPTT